MDFVSDALFDGRRLRALTVVDAFTREALAIDVNQGIRAIAASEPALPNVLWAGIHLEGTRPLGIRERCHAGLQPAGQAYGQRVCGVVQWPPFGTSA